MDIGDLVVQGFGSIKKTTRKTAFYEIIIMSMIVIGDVCVSV
jgi:hypothetical protein